MASTQADTLTRIRAVDLSRTDRVEWSKPLLVTGYAHWYRSGLYGGRVRASKQTGQA